MAVYLLELAVYNYAENHHRCLVHSLAMTLRIWKQRFRFILVCRLRARLRRHSKATGMGVKTLSCTFLSTQHLECLLFYVPMRPRSGSVDIPWMCLFRVVAFSEYKATSREKQFSPVLTILSRFFLKKKFMANSNEKFVKKKNETWAFFRDDLKT